MAGFSTFGELFGVNINETLSAIFFSRRSEGLEQAHGQFVLIMPLIPITSHNSSCVLMS
ncbi:hypothetical protein JCM19240_5381 [Vibrio maritimus]|uniref:Uncharacterized protein n=1 Tax=Vibrio maritimus TaxID=990268 RepID=A0A090SW04_9VIBR|nr:hypothetical protein JCM19240_5381 [Vibrio maritimus]